LFYKSFLVFFITNSFLIFSKLFHYRYQEISERVLLQKIVDAEKFVKTEYLADGTHSSDVTGSIDEATFPLWVKLFCKYISAMDVRVPKTVAERQKQDERCRTYQRIIGLQVSNLT
jgi:hypothetical protein